MADRYFKQFSLTMETAVSTIYGRFVVGSTGAVTANSVKGGCISGVVRNGTGDYTITLTDAFSCLLEFNAWIVSASGNSGIANIECYDATPANFQSDFATNKTVSVKCLDYAGAAADPASTDYFYFKLSCRNSSLNPFGFN